MFSSGSHMRWDWQYLQTPTLQQETRVQVPTLLHCCVTFSKSLNLSGSQFPLCKMEIQQRRGCRALKTRYVIPREVSQTDDSWANIYLIWRAHLQSRQQVQPLRSLPGPPKGKSQSLHGLPKQASQQQEKSTHLPQTFRASQTVSGMQAYSVLG